jgi:hypothetical protein
VTKYLLSLVLLAVCSLSNLRAAASNDDALWRPRFATPAIVALDTPANRTFTAELKASPAAKNWTACISNDLRGWQCQVMAADYVTINRNTEPGWRLKLSVPDDASPELFTLVVSCNESLSVQPQSVSVIPSFANDFYILHITDEQIVNQKHTDPSGQYEHTVGTWEEMKWMQEPINLINPRFVFITGDQIDYNGALDGWNNWPNWGYAPARYRTFTSQETSAIEAKLTSLYKDCHQGYRVAYVEAPGNHDVTPVDKPLKGSNTLWHSNSVAVYEKAFGQRSWSFRMGDFYVLMHDWSEHFLKDWAAKDFGESLADPSIKFRLIGQHYTTDHAFMPNSCDLMLVGHVHRTGMVQSSPYFIYEDGPAFSFGKTGFFNFKRLPAGWSCDQTLAQRDTAKDVWPLFTANGETKKVRINQPDSMNLVTNSVTIVNDLPENFYDGRVRFVLKKGICHSVNNGTILAQYDCKHGTKTAVLVRVNIPANGTTTITVH